MGTISEATLEREQVVLRGQLTAMTLIELLRTAEASGRDTVLELQTELGSGQIAFQRGEIFDARVGALEGRAALKALLGAAGSRFEAVQRRVSGRRTLRGSVMTLLATARASEEGAGASSERTGGMLVSPEFEAWRRRASEEVEPPATLNVDNVIGGYELLCRIGRGGMGAVFLCRLERAGGFERLFALKMLLKNESQSTRIRREFLAEARLGSRFHHPNLVAVVDFGTHAGQPYFVMQYIEGASLKRLLQRSPDARSPRLLLPIVLDALQGLHAAHSLRDAWGRPQPIVHCDISPENLLVGADGVCRVADFGIAQASTSGRPLRGKPAYLSPEVALGGSPDVRSDLFSLGVVIYNALTGMDLFRALTTEQVLENVLRQPIPAPSSVGLRPPSRLDGLILKALQRDPDRRFGSAEEMLIELRRMAANHDLLAPGSEVSAWVERLSGSELAQRRMAVLSKGNRRLVGESNGRREVLNLAPAPRVGQQGAPADDPPERLETTRSLRRRKLREPALIGASIAALAIIGMTLVWPEGVKEDFMLSGSATSGNENAHAPASRPARTPLAEAAHREAPLELAHPAGSASGRVVLPAGAPPGSTLPPVPPRGPQPEEN